MEHCCHAVCNNALTNYWSIVVAWLCSNILTMYWSKRYGCHMLLQQYWHNVLEQWSLSIAQQSYHDNHHVLRKCCQRTLENVVICCNSVIAMFLKICSCALSSPISRLSTPANLLLISLVFPSDWRPGGRGFNPRRGRQHSFVEIDHEIFSRVILSLPLIQEGQLSVSGERMCTILVNRLED